MATRLDKAIKRELEHQGQLYTVVLSPAGLKVTRKGARKGHELPWETIISGDAELYQDMRMSIDALKPDDD